MTHPDAAQLIIRPLEDAADCRQAEEIQLAAWGRDARSVSPAHVLLTAAHHGGVVLGAFAGDPTPEHMVGFTWGFLGLRPGTGIEGARLKLCSHQTGVLPAWQGLGVGFQLKCAQREVVLARGLELVTWTFDPLETANANLNIAKLGAVCNTYQVNLYGDGVDGPNVGLPTDRLVVDWWVASRRVAARLAATHTDHFAHPVRSRAALEADGATTCGASFDVSGLPHPPGDSQPTWAPATSTTARLLLEVPARFQALKHVDATLARAWRTHVRALLRQAFGAGYVITDFVFERTPAERAFYVLAHGADGPDLVD